MCLDLRREAFRFPGMNGTTTWTTAHGAALFSIVWRLRIGGYTSIFSQQRCIMSVFFPKHLLRLLLPAPAPPYYPSSTFTTTHHVLSPTKEVIPRRNFANQPIPFTWTPRIPSPHSIVHNNNNRLLPPPTTENHPYMSAFLGYPYLSSRVHYLFTISTTTITTTTSSSVTAILTSYLRFMITESIFFSSRTLSRSRSENENESEGESESGIMAVLCVEH